MSIKIWYQTEEQEFLHAEMQHYFEAVLQMQAEKASEQDADLKVIVEKRRYRKNEQEKQNLKNAVNGSGHCICILCLELIVGWRSGVWRMDAGVFRNPLSVSWT